jgi:hypothetical protein
MELPAIGTPVEGDRLPARSHHGSHRHYSNPFHPDSLITFAWHAGDVPRGIIADIIEDLDLTRDDFYFKRF